MRRPWKSADARGEKKILCSTFRTIPPGYTATEADAEAIRAAVLRAAEAGKKWS
jgi:hypothetical protein